MARSVDRRLIQNLAPEFVVLSTLVTNTSEVLLTGAFKVFGVSLTTDTASVDDIFLLDGTNIKFDAGDMGNKDRIDDLWPPAFIGFRTNVTITKGSGALRVSLYTNRLL